MKETLIKILQQHGIFFSGVEVDFKNEAKERILDLLKKKTELAEIPSSETYSDSDTQNKLTLPSNVTIDIDNQRTGSEADCDQGEIDTWIYPLLQMGPFGIVDDEVATKAIFRTAEKGEEILLASGYFNLTDYYIQVILQESQAKYNILMASPEVCMDYLLLLIQIKVVLRVGGYFCKV